MNQSAALLSQELALLAEAAVARVPGSALSPEAQRAEKRLRRDLAAYFGDLADAAGDAALSIARVNPAQTDYEAAVDFVMAARDQQLLLLLTDNISNGYMTGFEDVEQAFGGGTGVFSSAHSPCVERVTEPLPVGGGSSVSQFQLSAGVLSDLPYPTGVIRWAEQQSSGKVTQITETSRRRLRRTISEQLASERRGVPDVARAIRGQFSDMSRERSELIATTEMNFAVSTGSFERHVSLGATRKEWITVGDDRVSEAICKANQGQNQIPIRRNFQSGAPHTPGHPQCRCAVNYVGTTPATVASGQAPAGRAAALSNVGQGIRIATAVANATRLATQIP